MLTVNTGLKAEILNHLTPSFRYLLPKAIVTFQFRHDYFFLYTTYHASRAFASGNQAVGAVPQEERMADTKAQKIAHLNDRFRKHRLGRGRLMVTQGINEKGPEFVQRVQGLVAAFDDFTPENDPHTEHDFGSVEIDGEKIFWKVDYYDLDLKWGSEDPSDESQTCRVLTIMYSHEY